MSQTDDPGSLKASSKQGVIMEESLTDSMEENHFGNMSIKDKPPTDAMTASVGPDKDGTLLIAKEIDHSEENVAQLFRREQDISEVLDLDKLLKCIDMCGEYRYIVVNATADKANVLVKTQDALFSVLKLCDAVSLIVQNFQSGANNIMEKLKVAYLYLQDGFPDFAVTDIEATRKDVAMMRDRCDKTLSKVPGEMCISMTETVEADLNATMTNSLEGFLRSKKNSVAGDFASEEMVTSLDLIQQEENELEEILRTFDFIKKEELKAMTEKVDEGLSSLNSVDNPKEENKLAECLGPNFDVIKKEELEDMTEKVDEGLSSLNSVDNPKDQERASNSANSDYVILKLAQYLRYLLPDRLIIALYRYYNSQGTSTSPEKLEPEAVAVDKIKLQEEIPVADQETIRKIDSYFRAKLSSVIIEIVKNKYKEIRTIIKDALGHTQTWYEECKTLVEPVMKFNVERTQDMTPEEQATFWKTCDPNFEMNAQAYLDRWTSLHKHCDAHRRKLRELRQRIEMYYIDNPYPRDAIKNAWMNAKKAGISEPRIDDVVKDWEYNTGASVEDVLQGTVNQLAALKGQ